MKKVISIILAAFLGWGQIFAQDYSIYKTEGNVDILSPAMEAWMPAQKRAGLALSDMVRIARGASITLVETETRMLISCSQAGEFSVAELRTYADKRSESLLKSLNKKLMRDIRKEGAKNNHYSTYGATTRGLYHELSYSDSLYAAIYNFSSLIQATEVSDLILDKIPSGESTFYFKISNLSKNTTYFVNVLKSEGKELNYCYNFRVSDFGLLPLLPGQSADLSGYLFADSDTAVQYLVIGTTQPYPISNIERYLKHMETPWCAPADGCILCGSRTQ